MSGGSWVQFPVWPSFLFNTCTLSDDETTQLLISLSSLESRLEFVSNKTSSCSANCVKCKRQTQGTIEIMADSGASDCFTHTKSDLSEFEQINDKRLVVKTASAKNSCYEFFSTLTRADHAFYFSFSFMIYMHHPQG